MADRTPADHQAVGPVAGRRDVDRSCGRPAHARHVAQCAGRAAPVHAVAPLPDVAGSRRWTAHRARRLRITPPVGIAGAGETGPRAHLRHAAGRWIADETRTIAHEWCTPTAISAAVARVVDGAGVPVVARGSGGLVHTALR